ncbi:MAG TPA: protoporphyrinogen oxidase, partial [Kofleriaceae bacterium]|nr:protoporphyrinogen oxidase [Kofleriaceae bacterium]
MSTVAVIGGGIAGLTCARALRRAGHTVTVIEAADRPGGVIRSSRRDGFLREYAANGFLPAEAGAVELAGELGVAIEEAAAAARKRWVYVDGALQAVPGGLIDAVRSDLLSWRGKLAVLGEPFRPNGLGAEETVAEFARRRLGEEAARKLIGPFVTGVFAGDAEQLSLPAAFPKLAALDVRGGLVRGSIAGMFERMGQKKEKQEKKDKKKRMRMAAPVGGVEALVRALADEVGPSLRCGVAAAAIEAGDGGARVRLADGGQVSADHLVLAVPAWAAASLVR